MAAAAANVATAAVGLSITLSTDLAKLAMGSLRIEREERTELDK